MKAADYTSIKTCFFIYLLSAGISLHAQQDKMNITGTYFMRGVMETASVIALKPDSSFEFFFSQGALDRYGKGKWTVKDNSIVLNSGMRPAKDFALISSKATAGNYTTVVLAAKNSMILPYTAVTIQAGNKILKQTTDSHGEVHFPKQAVSSISLLFTLCPDRESVFAINNKSYNHFEFRLEPWIAEIFFVDFNLRIAENLLTGPHPLLEGNTFRYEKE